MYRGFKVGSSGFRCDQLAIGNLSHVLLLRPAALQAASRCDRQQAARSGGSKSLASMARTATSLAAGDRCHGLHVSRRAAALLHARPSAQAPACPATRVLPCIHVRVCMCVFGTRRVSPRQVMPFSTACSTPLSNFEAGLNYKDVADPAVMVRLSGSAFPSILMCLLIEQRKRQGEAAERPVAVCQACVLGRGPSVCHCSCRNA